MWYMLYHCLLVQHVTEASTMFVFVQFQVACVEHVHKTAIKMIPSDSMFCCFTQNFVQNDQLYIFWGTDVCLNSSGVTALGWLKDKYSGFQLS